MIHKEMYTILYSTFYMPGTILSILHINSFNSQNN